MEVRKKMDTLQMNNVFEIYCGNGMKKLIQICYPIIIKIGGISQCDYDDFYSIANKTVWEAAMNYDETQHDNFEVFLKGCISKKFMTEMTRRNRGRRIPTNCIDRLDQPLSEDGEMTFGDTVKSEFDLDDKIENLSNGDNLINYLDSLTPKQKKIAKLVIEGYELSDIKRLLHMSDEKFNNCINRMKTFDKRIMLGNIR